MPVSLEDLTTDQLLAHARALEGPASLFQTLSQTPETREQLQRLIKKANPKLVIPEIDAADAVRTEMKTRDDKIAELENKMLERDIRERLERQRKHVQEHYRLSDTDLVEVEKMMTDTDPDKRIPGYEAATRVYLAQKQSAAPTPSSIKSHTYTMPDKDVWSGGIGNPAKLNRIAIEEAERAFSEIAQGKMAG